MDQFKRRESDFTRAKKRYLAEWKYKKQIKEKQHALPLI